MHLLAEKVRVTIYQVDPSRIPRLYMRLKEYIVMRRIHPAPACDERQLYRGPSTGRIIEYAEFACDNK